jgi:hypothetical protein
MRMHANNRTAITEAVREPVCMHQLAYQCLLFPKQECPTAVVSDEISSARFSPRPLDEFPRNPYHGQITLKLEVTKCPNLLMKN